MELSQVTKRDRVDFNEADVELAIMVLTKTRDVFSFFKYLKERKNQHFAVVLLKSATLKKHIIKEKRDTDVLVDLGIEDMTLIILPDTRHEGSDNFIKRMMLKIQENSGDFASIVEVNNNVDLEYTIFTLLVDYLMMLKQPIEWRTGQVSYNEV